MKRKTGGSLKRAFTRAALGLSVLVGGCATFNNQVEPPLPENKPVDPAWEQVLTEYSRPYNYDQGATVRLPARTGGTIAVQIESSINDSRGMLLHPRISPLTILSRHGESAASILNRTADGTAGTDIEVHFVEKASRLDEWFMDASSPEAKAIFGNADIVVLSMGYPARGDQRFAYSNGNIDTPAEIAEADAFWRNTDAIYVESAGNSGDEPLVDLERAHATLAMRADAIVRVGEAGIDSRGVYIEDHSSHSSPAFVTSNPFFHGFSYPYIRDQELRGLIDEIYSTPVEGYGGATGAEIFAEKLKVLAAAGPFSGVRPPRYSHPDFPNASFPGKDVLERDAQWQAAHPDEVREAFINAVVASGDFLRDYLEADQNDFISRLYGTSFSAPHAGGMLAAAHQKYPQLNEYDLIAAALIASRPAERVKRVVDGPMGLATYFESVAYQDNGSGMGYNDRVGGFGYLNPELYERTTALMAEMVDENRRLASREARIEQEFSFSASTAAQGPRSYTFEIEDDITAIQTGLAIRFKGGPSAIPDKITLINPAGGEIEVSPTRLRGGMAYSLAETIGHAGNSTEGEWTIRVPDGVEIESVRLTITGTQRGSVIEEYLDRYGPVAPEEQNVTEGQASPWTPGESGGKGFGPFEEFIIPQR